MSKIDKHHTACKDCIFAVYEENTQTSCYLNVIDRIRNSENLEVLEAYDEEKEFYVVNKTKCPYFRKDLKDKTLEERAEEVQKNVHLKYVLLINARPEMPMEKIKDILSDIKKASIRPKGVLLIVYKESLSKRTNEEYLQVIRESDLGCEWRITKVLDENTPFVYTLHNQANLMADKHLSILSVDGDHSKIANMVDMANDLVFNQFKTFNLISNESKEALLFSSIMYRDAMRHGVDILESANLIV